MARVAKEPSADERLAAFDEASARVAEKQWKRTHGNEPLTQAQVDQIYNDELRTYAQQCLDHPDWTVEQRAHALGSTTDRIRILSQWLSRGWTRDELYERGSSR